MEILPRGSLENEQLNIILLCVFVCETQICITELLAVTAMHSAARVYTCMFNVLFSDCQFCFSNKVSEKTYRG